MVIGDGCATLGVGGDDKGEVGDGDVIVVMLIAIFVWYP